MSTSRLLPLAICALALFFSLVACSSDPDASADVGHTPDVVVDDVDADDVAEDLDDTGPDDVFEEPEPLDSTYCETCRDDDDCAELGALCIELGDGQMNCGQACEVDSDCPDDARCFAVDEDDTTQCVPIALTCDDPCVEINCPAGQYCNPLEGACQDQPRICSTGCNFDIDCGDPAQNRCLTTGAPDGERMCTISCDPGAEGELQCPSDFFCIAIEEGSEEGICFPFARTCIDRCVDQQCPAGHNCDPFTGECVEAFAGACEPGCQIDAHCDGPSDVCLNIGIGETSHCWADCTATQTCPEGYDCMAFLGFTTNLCIPPGQQCEACYDADCFPDGICNPATGECMPHPEDCLVEGCDDEQLCEPTSRRCVEIDQSCRGEAWAVDCDNVITRCTSQTEDVEGICATICFGDDDCQGDRSCTATIYGDLCLGPDLGGHQHCGVLTEPGAVIGRPCQFEDDGDNCSGNRFCVETGGLPGFCTRGCDDGADCPDGYTCGVGPEGQAICLPAQCSCAQAPGFAPDLDQGWTAMLDEAGLTVCDLTIPSTTDDAILSGLLNRPAAAIGLVHQGLHRIDEAQNLAELLAAAPFLSSHYPTLTEIILDDQPDLLQALEDLATTAGGTLDPAPSQEELDQIPLQVQVLAAHLVQAIDAAYQARLDAFNDAGLDESTLQLLFDEAPSLLLPHSDGQPPLDDLSTALADAIDAFPLGTLIEIAANLTATVEAALDEHPLNLEEFEDPFSLVVHTPAGAVIIGDGDDNSYDPTDFDGLPHGLALLLEVGGDNTYLIPGAANHSVANGISLLIDLAGDDTYSYPAQADPLDGDHLLASDADGRASAEGLGPVSLSDVGRQGSGRLGIALHFDLGGENTYETLRMGQGSGIFGVGALFDTGDLPTTFDAEAFAQGAGLMGLGLLHSAGGDNSYRIWHAGQGFAAAGGVGLLHDHMGDDNYLAVPGLDEADRLIYPADADNGTSNASLAQGAASTAAGLGNGLGVLRDRQGHDHYIAGTYAQGFGDQGGLGILADGDGDDHYQGRNYCHATGRDGGAGILFDAGGDDHFTQSSFPPERGQGAGERHGWGALIVDGGENLIDYNILGGGMGFDGGMGFALFRGGPNDHQVIGGGLGLASVDLPADSPYAQGLTFGGFVQTGGAADLYTHPADGIGLGNDATWRQDDEDTTDALGVGVDQ